MLIHTFDPMSSSGRCSWFYLCACPSQHLTQFVKMVSITVSHWGLLKKPLMVGALLNPKLSRFCTQGKLVFRQVFGSTEVKWTCLDGGWVVDEENWENLCPEKVMIELNLKKRMNSRVFKGHCPIERTSQGKRGSF